MAHVSDREGQRLPLEVPEGAKHRSCRWSDGKHVLRVLKGFWAARGRPEPQNDRFSIKSLNLPLARNLQRTALGAHRSKAPG